MKKALSLLIAAVMLISAMPSVVMADDSAVQMLSQEVQPLLEDYRPITIKTANQFAFGKYSLNVPFEVDGLDADTYYSVKICFEGTDDYSSSYFTKIDDDSRYCTYYTSTAVADNTVLKPYIEIYKSSTLLYKSEPFEITIKPSDYKGITVKPESVPYDTNSYNYITAESPLSGFDKYEIRLIDANDVVYATKYSVYSYNTNIKDIRYNGMFSDAVLEKINCNGYYYSITMQQVREIPEGIYDVLIYNDENSFREENAITVTKTPKLQIYDNSQYLAGPQIGDTEFYLDVHIYNGNIEDYDIEVLLQGEKIAESTDECIIYNSYGTAKSYKVKFKTINGPLKKANFNYDVTVTHKEDKPFTYQQTSFSLNYLSPYIQDSLIPHPQKANVVLKATDVSPQLNYRFRLNLNGTDIATVYQSPDENGFFDLEFLDEAGEVITFENYTYYNVYIDAIDNGEWKHKSSEGFNIRYPEEDSSEPATTTTGNGWFTNGILQVNLYASAEDTAKFTDTSKFKVVATNPIGEEFIYDELSLDYKKEISGNRTRFYMTTPIGELPDAAYRLKLYYNDEEVVNAQGNNIMGNYTTTYTAKSFEIISRIDGDDRIYQPTIGFLVEGYEEITSVELKLYPMPLASAVPSHTIQLVESTEEDTLYSIPAGTDIDIFKKFYAVVTVNNKFIQTFTGTPYCFVPMGYTEDTSIHTIEAENVSNGTLTLSQAEGIKGDTIYVTATPDQGYEFVPGSMTVNGESIYGRGFTLAGDSVVSGTFRPVTYGQYIPTVGSSPEGTITFDKTEYQPGETVTVTIKPKKNYIVNGVTCTANGQTVTVTPVVDKTTYSFVMPEEGYVQVSATYSYQTPLAVSDYDIYSYTNVPWIKPRITFNRNTSGYMIAGAFKDGVLVASNIRYYSSASFWDSTYLNYGSADNKPDTLRIIFVQDLISLDPIVEVFESTADQWQDQYMP